MTYPELETVNSTREDADGIDGAQLDRVMGEVPSGAMALAGAAVALAGAAVALLTIAWVAIYLFVFVPRGVVG